ncbi:hypothetical protein [Cystobacter fuscus]|uniref:hypothetical protein n=1 Tax=Cystobacter fuscus TaxID=43 RepID=UPI0012DE11C0|nr:hypothetical protein [Cystobacter fuscus]
MRSLAVVRILTGAGVVFDVLYRARDLEAHYTQAGVISTETARALVEYFGWFSLHTLSGSLAYQIGLSALFLVLGLLLMVGFATRLVTPLCWMLYVSVQNRFFAGDYPGDYVLTLLLLSGICLPWGAWFSVDAWRGRGRAMPAPRYRGLSAHAFFLLFTVFLCNTGISKFAAGDRWLDGKALYLTLSSIRYTSHWLDWTLEHLTLLEVVTYAVPWIELVSPVVLFFPWKNGGVRTLAVAIICAMFTSFGIGLDLHQLPFLAAVAYLGFLPPWFWDRFLPALSRGAWWRAPPSEEAVSHDLALAPGRVFVSINNGLVAVLLALHATHYYYKIGNYGYFSTPRSPPVLVDKTLSFLKMKNIYRMFSDPRVFEQSDGWDVAPGVLASGREINVFTGDALSFEQPKDLIQSIGGFRWRQYLTLMNWYPTWNPKNITSYHVIEYAAMRRDLARYLCRQWNARHTGADMLVRMNLAMVIAPVRYAQPKPSYRVVELLEQAHPCEDVGASPARGPVAAPEHLEPERAAR